MNTLWHHWWLAICGLVCALGISAAAWSSTPQQKRVRHFAPNANFDAKGDFLPGKAGFDIGDVSSRTELDFLPKGAKGLVWIGQCNGVDANFEKLVRAVIDHPKLFGFYLMDDPDPTGQWRLQCTALDLRAESDWIHRRRPEAVTFVALMNVGSSASPEFSAEYAPDNSHVDLFSIAPYPCRTGWAQCDYDMIDRYIAASRDAGFPLSRIVPTFQSFGGGEWRADSGGSYRLPTSSELRSMLERWGRLAPEPAFDFAYSWGQQRSDDSLAASADLQAVFARHNHEARSPALLALGVDRVRFNRPKPTLKFPVVQNPLKKTHPTYSKPTANAIAARALGPSR
jgi:hypothetical protein